MDESEPAPASEGWAASFIRGDADVDLTPLRLEKRRLADAMRQVIESLVSSDLDDDQVATAADDLEAIAARFRSVPTAPYVGFSEAANSPSAAGFFDHSPVIGAANPLAPPIHLEHAEDRIVGRVTFGSAYEGPPGCVHGGWIAASFDEVLGTTQSLGGAGGMTAYLKVDYRSPTPLYEELRFEGEIERVEGRKIFTRGRLHHGEVLTAEAEALFVTVDFGRFVEMRRQRDGAGPPA